MASLADRPLGGRETGESGVNSGLLRCPVCFSRLVSCRGELRLRQGPDAVLHVPRKPPPPTTSQPQDVAQDAAQEVAQGSEPEWVWTQHEHAYWWRVACIDDVDSIGLSREVASPIAGPLRAVLCSECHYGPFGYQAGGEACLSTPPSLKARWIDHNYHGILSAELYNHYEFVVSNL